jgi:hypothetical protein
MARIVPSDISRLALAGGHREELKTLGALKGGLPDAYTVFHSVHWSREYEHHSVYGEIDFVVVNRSGDALVIEQKMGRLEETDRGLIKKYDTGEKNVGYQIHRSRDLIWDKFYWTHGNARKLELDYLIYCPGHHIKNLNAPGLERSHIVDAGKKDLAGQIQKMLGPGSSSDTDWTDKVLEFFYQSFEVVPDVHAYVSAQERAYTRLCGGLVSLVDNLEMTPFRLRVDGVAGCGKSQAARHFFDKAIENGKHPLLVCFNRPLSERIKTNVREGGMVHTWYGLCDSFLKEQGHKLDYDKMSKDPDFWNKAQEKVLEAKVPDSWRFDTVIIDEGQDFEPEWHEMLTIFMKNEADVLWLEDPVQNLRQTSVVNGHDFVVYHARENYRTPTSIARFVQKTMPFEFVCGNDLPGMGVGISPYEKPEEQKKIVDHIVRELMKRGFGNEDIVVLTCRGVQSSVLSETKEIGGLPVRRFTGEYDHQGNQVFTDGKLYFDSVYRYKGQQAPAVVLVDVDPSSKNQDREHRALFSGMTRATVRLEMVVNGSNPANGPFLG